VGVNWLSNQARHCSVRAAQLSPLFNEIINWFCSFVCSQSFDTCHWKGTGL